MNALDFKLNNSTVFILFPLVTSMFDSNFPRFKNSFSSQLYKVINSLYISVYKWILNIFNFQKQILWLDGDEFTVSPVRVLNRIERFLGVPRYFTEQHFEFSGRKGYPCFKLDPDSHSRCMGEKKARDHPGLSDKSLNILRRYYKPKLEKFKARTGVDVKLSWLTLINMILYYDFERYIFSLVLGGLKKGRLFV